MLARMTQAAEGALDFNTGIAEVYKLLNAFDEIKPDPKTDDEKAALQEVLTILCRTLAPLAPFLGEEFHEMLGGTGSVFKAAWPEFDAVAAKADEVEIPVQVNGKLRAKFLISPDASEDALKAAALALPALKRHHAEAGDRREGPAGEHRGVRVRGTATSPLLARRGDAHQEKVASFLC